MTGDLHEVFARAADALPDEPGRLEAVLRRRRRRVQRRAMWGSAGVVVLILGGVALVTGPPQGSSPSPAADAAAGDCAHGGTPLPLDGPVPTVPPPTPGSDGSYAPVNHIALRLYPDCTSVRVGQPMTIRVVATGDAATPSRDQLTQEGLTSMGAPSCLPASPAPPRGGTYDERIVHTYKSPGSDVVTIGVSAFCSPYEGRATASVTVQVLSDQGEAVTEHQDPLALIGRWHLDVPGQGDASLILGEQLVLFQRCGMMEGQWRAEGADGLFLGSLYGSDPTCVGLLGRLPWLEQARAFRVDGDNRLLLDRAGKVVATLRPGATPTAGPNAADSYAAEPTISAQQRIDARDPAPLPRGVRAPTEGDLERRWLPDRDPSGKGFVAFGSDGSWRGFAGCSATSGYFVLGTAGRLLILGPGAVAAIGCVFSVPATLPLQTVRVGLDGDELVFFDRNAHELGRVHPA